MPEKKELTKEQEKNIIKLYLVDDLSFKKIKKETGFSENISTRILKTNNVYVFRENFKSFEDYKILKKEKYDLYIKGELNETTRFDSSKTYIAVCKKTGEVFDDYLNKNGYLTKYIQNILNIKDIPDSKLKRKDIEFKTGKFWYEEYFNIIEIKKKEIVKCRYCDWKTTDLVNRSGCITVHIDNIHNVKWYDHIKKFPEDCILFDKTKI